ncbi:TolC family protein [Pseudomaricurvus sp.]|uniref:TolC family protein n=1 Tax=Pseudomaricurvus sp. TaxID=2004510 RepID=UPI003F6B02DB
MCILWSGQRRLLPGAWMCACLLLILPFVGAAQTEAIQRSITLEQALRKSLNNNPELQMFQWRFKALDGQQQSADLAPPLELGFEAENILGSDNYSGMDSAELTVSLSSVIELGGKRDSRLALADSRYVLAEAERQAQSLNLLGKVTQSFIVALTLQEKLQVAEDTTRLATDSHQLVGLRVQRGAAPEAERLRAKAAVTQARLKQAALEAQLRSQKLTLATLWGAERVMFERLSGDLSTFDASSGFEVLYQRALTSPAIEVLSREERVRDADVELARSQASANMQWSIGVRRFEETNDTALTAGLSVPLFSGRRKQGALKTALAEKAMVGERKRVSLLALRSRLFQAWQTHQQSVVAARQMRKEVLPLLERAMEQTREAYEQGRYRYRDWIAAQQELLNARLETIDAASFALLNQALIEQLTAQSLANDDEQKTTTKQYVDSEVDHEAQ